jgi:hypothetical protein
VQLPSTNHCVRETGSQCARCDLKLVVYQDRVEGELLLPERRRPVPPRPPFTARASIEGRFLGPRDVGSARLRVAVVDAKGMPIVDSTVEGGAWDAQRKSGWTGNAKEGYVFRDERKESTVPRISLRPDAKGEAYRIEIEGSLPEGSASRVDASSRPTLAIHFAWKEDVAPLLVAAKGMTCVKAADGLRCTAKAGK